MRNKILFIMLLCAIPAVAVTYPFTYETCNLGYTHVHHKHNEASYQHAYCSAVGGIEEYENSDKTRVDCLTDKYSIEFDFANKWHESIGQALHYGIMTGKKPKVVLILDNPKTQMVYYKRVKRIADAYGFEVEYITDDILKLNSEGECENPKCKCHKTKNTKIKP